MRFMPRLVPVLLCFWIGATAQADEVADAEAALTSAAAANKLALIVFGADWCHDTKALLKNLKKEDVAAVVEENYVYHFVDVGYLEQGFDVANRFGLAIYTHTPTVLMIDPETDRVVNADDHFIWRDAYKKSAQEVEAYLTAKTDPAIWAEPVPEEISISAAYQSALAKIGVFETEQADRLRTAYGLIGPRLRDKSDDLDDYWDPVREVRYRLPDDLLAMKASAREQVEVGVSEVEIALPDYGKFQWE